MSVHHPDASTGPHADDLPPDFGDRTALTGGGGRKRSTIPHTIQKYPAEALPKGSASTRLSMVTHVETPARRPGSSNSYTASSSLSSLTSAQMSMIPRRTTWQKSRQESSFVMVVRGSNSKSSLSFFRQFRPMRSIQRASERAVSWELGLGRASRSDVAT
jgi:hypothetical protein